MSTKSPSEEGESSGEAAAAAAAVAVAVAAECQGMTGADADADADADAAAAPVLVGRRKKAPLPARLQGALADPPPLGRVVLRLPSEDAGLDAMLSDWFAMAFDLPLSFARACSKVSSPSEEEESLVAEPRIVMSQAAGVVRTGSFAAPRPATAAAALCATTSASRSSPSSLSRSVSSASWLLRPWTSSSPCPSCCGGGSSCGVVAVVGAGVLGFCVLLDCEGFEVAGSVVELIAAASPAMYLFAAGGLFSNLSGSASGSPWVSFSASPSCLP
mmetsp:Transcript_59560/g.130805  ORF Transcript_59560/g.130805 Transcript_59560/m.130805 type:complete len:273 (+) Transcript_59560:386-1204(+)